MTPPPVTDIRKLMRTTDIAMEDIDTEIVGDYDGQRVHILGVREIRDALEAERKANADALDRANALLREARCWMAHPGDLVPEDREIRDDVASRIDAHLAADGVGGGDAPLARRGV